MSRTLLWFPEDLSLRLPSTDHRLASMCGARIVRIRTLSKGIRLPNSLGLLLPAFSSSVGSSCLARGVPASDGKR